MTNRFRLRRWHIVVVASLVVCVGLATLAFAILYPVYRGFPAPAVSPPANAAEGMRQDLDFLAKYPEVNRSFTAAQRGQYQAAIASIRNDVPQLDAATFETRVSQAVAIADEGHARVRGVAYGLSMNSVPLRANWFSEGLVVTSAEPPWEAALGRQIVAIDGRPVAELLPLVESVVGGAPSIRHELSPRLLLAPALLKAIGATTDAAAVVLTLRSPDGSTQDLTVPADAGPANGPPTSAEPQRTLLNNRWPRRDLSPVAFPADTRPWQHVLAGAALPLYLQHPESWYWDQPLGSGASFLQINAVRNQAGQPPLATYLDDYMKRLGTQKIATVVLDLRADTGGNGDLVTAFSQRLPQVLGDKGRIFVLTSGNTFSAAIILAARLRYYGHGMVELVGQPMGDRPQFWAEGRAFRLPNLGIEVEWTAAYHDWQNGCSIWQVFVCHPLNYLVGVAAGPLDPDLVVDQSFGDYRAGVDSALRAIADREGVRWE